MRILDLSYPRHLPEYLPYPKVERDHRSDPMRSKRNLSPGSVAPRVQPSIGARARHPGASFRSLRWTFGALRRASSRAYARGFKRHFPSLKRKGNKKKRARCNQLNRMHPRKHRASRAATRRILPPTFVTERF